MQNQKILNFIMGTVGNFQIFSQRHEPQKIFLNAIFCLRGKLFSFLNLKEKIEINLTQGTRRIVCDSVVDTASLRQTRNARSRRKKAPVVGSWWFVLQDHYWELY